MGLRSSILRDPISALTPRPFVQVHPGATVRQTIDQMKRQKAGAAIIVRNERPFALFTEKMLIRLLLSQPTAMDDAIELHADPHVVCLRRDEPVARLIATMQRRRLRWVCIINDAGIAVGVAGLRAAIDYVVDFMPLVVRVEPMEGRVAMEEREGA